jgi:hypothetical protein
MNLTCIFNVDPAHYVYETEIMDMDIQKDCAEGYTAIG